MGDVWVKKVLPVMRKRKRMSSKGETGRYGFYTIIL